MMLLSPLILLFTNILISLILLTGGGRAQIGTIKLGVLVGLIEYATISLSNIQQFCFHHNHYPEVKGFNRQNFRGFINRGDSENKRRRFGIVRRRHQFQER